MTLCAVGAALQGLCGKVPIASEGTEERPGRGVVVSVQPLLLVVSLLQASSLPGSGVLPPPETSHSF